MSRVIFASGQYDYQIFGDYVNAEGQARMNVDETGRRRIALSQKNYDLFHSFATTRERENAGWITVEDENTGEEIKLRWADCGLDCYCAAEWSN